LLPTIHVMPVGEAMRWAPRDRSSRPRADATGAESARRGRARLTPLRGAPDVLAADDGLSKIEELRTKCR
jgi:hypothetical protein